MRGVSRSNIVAVHLHADCEYDREATGSLASSPRSNSSERCLDQVVNAMWRNRRRVFPGRMNSAPGLPSLARR
jgi:hypothetical protein